MKKYTQAEKIKIIIHEIIELQTNSVIPTFITEILCRGGLDTSTYTALSELGGKSSLNRVDMYSLFFPYNSTEHGKIMYMYLIGLRGKKNIKASVRNVFSQLVCREAVMNTDPVLLYNGRAFSIA